MNNLKDQVLEFIRENGNTYIYELEPLFDKACVPFEGNRSLTFDGDKNRVFFTTAQQNQVQLYRSCIKKTKYQLFITHDMLRSIY